MHPSPVAPVFQLPDWLAYTVAGATVVGVIVTTGGVLTALYVALSNAAKNREEREERIAAQARKVVPTLARAEVLGSNMWTVAVANRSDSMIVDLDVTVKGYDDEGKPVEDPIQIANSRITQTEAFTKLLSDGIAGGANAAASRARRDPMAAMFFGSQFGQMPDVGSLIGPAIAPQVARIGPHVQQVLNGFFTTEWPAVLTPGREVSMVVEASDRVRDLLVVVTFTDEAGYRWFRTDVGLPKRLDAED